MRRLRLALGLGALLLACAACGQDSEVGFGGAPPATSGDLPTAAPSMTIPAPSNDADPMNPSPPPGATPVAKDKVDATALPEGYPRAVWTEGDGTTVGAYGQAGGCTQAKADLVAQNPRQVVMRITETTVSTGPCTMEILYPPLSVKLDAPLGERTVVLQRQQVGPS